MDRKLLGYLPPVLREVMEMQAINEANEPEIAIAWDAITLVLANQFLETADVCGVSIWEKELKIFPKDTDTLAGRKARIKAVWNLEIPYTIPWLKNWLTGICGPEGHEETIVDYTINIQLDYNVLPDADSLASEILKMLLAVRPSNMRVMLTAFLQSYGTISFGAAAEMSQAMEVYPWIVRGMKTTGALRSGAYTEQANHIDVWPKIVRGMRSSGTSIMAGALEYHAILEIYPKEGTANAQ